MPATDNNDRAAIVELTPEFLAQILQLPPGAYIDVLRMKDDQMGVLVMRLRGSGWPVVPGCLIPHAAPTLTAEGPQPWHYKVDWHLPS